MVTTEERRKRQKRQERQKAKTCNFLLIYLGSPYRLQKELRCSEEEANYLHKRFFDTYEHYYSWAKEQIEKIKLLGRVTSEAGRIRRLPAVKIYPQDSKEYKHAIRQGLNFIIQSLGASITKRAMLALDRAGFQVITQVHDSVTIQIKKEEAPEAIEKVREIAESAYPLSVPLKADLKLLTSFSESDILILTGGKDDERNCQRSQKSSRLNGQSN